MEFRFRIQTFRVQRYPLLPNCGYFHCHLNDCLNCSSRPMNTSLIVKRQAIACNLSRTVSNTPTVCTICFWSICPKKKKNCFPIEVAVFNEMKGKRWSTNYKTSANKSFDISTSLSHSTTKPHTYTHAHTN